MDKELSRFPKIDCPGVFGILLSDDRFSWVPSNYINSSITPLKIGVNIDWYSLQMTNKVNIGARYCFFKLNKIMSQLDPVQGR